MKEKIKMANLDCLLLLKNRLARDPEHYWSTIKSKMIFFEILARTTLNGHMTDCLTDLHAVNLWHNTEILQRHLIKLISLSIRKVAVLDKSADLILIFVVIPVSKNAIHISWWTTSPFPVLLLFTSDDYRICMLRIVFDLNILLIFKYIKNYSIAFFHSSFQYKFITVKPVPRNKDWDKFFSILTIENNRINISGLFLWENIKNQVSRRK